MKLNIPLKRLQLCHTILWSMDLERGRVSKFKIICNELYSRLDLTTLSTVFGLSSTLKGISPLDP